MYLYGTEQVCRRRTVMLSWSLQFFFLLYTIMLHRYWLKVKLEANKRTQISEVYVGQHEQ